MKGEESFSESHTKCMCKGPLAGEGMMREIVTRAMWQDQWNRVGMR